MRPIRYNPRVRRPALVLALCAALPWTGCWTEPAEDGAPPPPARPALDEDAVARGRAAYLRYCALCHGPDGEGYLADNAPALRSPDFLRVASDAFLRVAIAEGHPGTPMSAWHRDRGGPLDDGGVQDLVVYLRSLSDEPLADVTQTRIEGDRVRGGQLFAAHCAGCHGAEGQGVTAVSLSSEVFLRTASDGFVRETIARGRRGTPMEGYDGRLSSEEIDALTSFVRALPRRTLPPPAPVGPPPPDLANIVLHPEGPPPTFQLREDRFVSGAAVRAALDAGQRLILLDARAPSDWAAGHITGAVPFPFYDAEQLIQHIPDRDTWVVAYCACPHAASGRVVDQLRAAGHTRSAVLDEGIGWWIQQGHPTERGSLP